MLSDADFSSKSGSVSDIEDLAPAALSSSTTSGFSLFAKNKDSFHTSNLTNMSKMAKEELKQLLIKAVVPEVVQ